MTLRPLDVCAARIESLWKVGPSTDTRFAATGEPVVDIKSESCTTEVDAAAGLERAILAYGQKGGVLYWRQRPVLVRADNDMVYAYARLLISKQGISGGV